MALILPNSCFVHIPRTSGTWVRCVLRNASLNTGETGLDKDYGVNTIHHTISQAKEWIGDRRTFAFVRNPLTYLQSRWLRRSWPMMERKVIKIPDKFTDFIDAYLNETPSGVTKLFSKFTGWNFDGTVKDVHVDYIGKAENQPFDLLSILRKCGEQINPNIAYSEPKRHTSKGKFKWEPEEVWWPRSLMLSVMEQDKGIFETFQYGGISHE